MTQGHGEDKVKLHTMNLVAAGPPLRDNIFFSNMFKIQWGVHNTYVFHDCSLPFLTDRKKEKEEGFWSILRCNWDGFGTHARLVVLGSSTH